MFSFLITRIPKSEIHIITYQISSGSYRTVCGKSFGKYLNILSADNVFPGVCEDCKQQLESSYSNAVKFDIASTHNKFVHQKEALLDFHRNELLGPKDLYEGAFERDSRMIRKYKKLLKKRK